MKYLLLFFTVLLTGCGKPKQQLHLFLWPEYLDPKVVADFERQFDCKVTVDLFESVDTMLTKLAAGGSSAYDIVTTGHSSVPVLAKRRLLAPLRLENLPNLKNVDAQFLNPPYDPGNRYSVPYQWGTAGIYMRKPQGRPVEETWGLLFDPAKQPGTFLLTEDIRFCFGAALQYQGHHLDSTNPKEIMGARDLLLEAKKRSSGFASSFGGKNRVLSKDAVLCIAYNNDAINGEAEDPETYFLIPREGGGLWMDTLSIPANAPHRDLAEKFVNYILDARTGARVSNFNRCATPNKAALEFITPAVRSHPGIYPPPDVMKRLQMANDLGETNKLYDEMWTQIKSK